MSVMGYLQHTVTSQDGGQIQCLSGVVCAWQEELDMELSIYSPAVWMNLLRHLPLSQFPRASQNSVGIRLRTFAVNISLFLTAPCFSVLVLCPVTSV